MERYGSIQSSRIRKPPQTELETLSSTRAWLILLFPVFLSILTVLIDSNSKIHTKESDINKSRCPDYLNCKLSPGYLVLSFKKPPIILNFVGMSAVLEPPAQSINSSILNEYDIENINQDNIIYFHTTISSSDLNHNTHSQIYEKYKFYNETKLVNSPNRQHIIQLLDWSFDQPSLAGNKIFLTFNISFSHNLITNNIFSKLVLKTQRIDYLLVKCISMITLSLFTIAAILFWIIRTISYINKSRQKLQKTFSLRTLIAEQIYTLILLFFLLLWQGAPYAISLLLIIYPSSRSEISDKLLFTVGLMRDVGQQGIYFIFLILADGLHYSETSFHQSLQLKKIFSGNDILLNANSKSYSKGSRRTGAPEWTYEESKSGSHNCSSSSSITNRTTFSSSMWSTSSGTTKGIYNHIDDLESSATRLPTHHPMSPFVIDFLVWKTALFLTACMLVTVKRSLNFPYYFGYLWGDSVEDQMLVMNTFAFTSLLRVMISLLWVILFLLAMSRTARQLRKDRYMTSRFRQMAWRLLMNQVFLGVTIIGVTYAIQIYQFIVLMTVDRRRMEFHDIWDASIRLLSERFVSWAGEDTQIGELFYVSVVCYTITYVFSVPSLSSHSSEYAGTSHAWIALESELEVFTEAEVVPKSYSIEMIPPPPLPKEGLLPQLRPDTTQTSSKSTLSTTDQHNHQATTPFCLETACFLLECTWQSYFPPEGISMYSPNDPLPNLLGTAVAANMDVKRLGLKLTKYFCDRETDSWGYVATKKNRIVVCFRGTVGFMNITTDLKLTQIPLPRLTLSDSELLELLCALKGSMSDQDEMLSNTDLYSVSSLLQSITDHPITEKGIDDHVDVEQSTPYIKSHPPEKKEKASDKKESLERKSSCLKSLLTKLPIAKQVLPRIHAGFWESYSTVRKDMMKGVTEAICDHYSTSNLTENNNNSTKDKFEICICGHSLGGAIAVLAALEISLNLKKLLKITSLAHRSYPTGSSIDNKDFVLPSISLYTYGTPRVGNPTFARLVNKSIATYYRVETDGDFFVSIPKFFGTYRHAGIPVLVDSEKSGCLIVKPTVVEHHFFRQSGSSAACHALERYRDCLEACFESDEIASYMSKEYEATTAALKSLPSAISKSKATGSGSGSEGLSTTEKKKTITLPEWLITSR